MSVQVPFRMATPLDGRRPSPPPLRAADSSTSTGNARGSPSSLPPPSGVAIPLYAQPAISSPAVYRLEEHGRAFILYSRDLHRSHAPLRNKGQRAIAPSLSRSQTEPQPIYQPPFHIPSLPQPLGHIHRASASDIRLRGVGAAALPAQEVEVAPASPPPPVEFPFEPCTEDALRRTIPPPLEPPPPPPPPPGYSKPNRRPVRRPGSPTLCLSRKQDLPLPQLLQDIDFNKPLDDRHTKVLLNLFAQHELAMQTTMANASVVKPMVTRPTGGRTSKTDRVLIEREDMAMRRKLILRPQSLTM